MPAVNLRHIEIFHAVMTTGNPDRSGEDAAHLATHGQPRAGAL